jgi:hypothetical protein
MKTLLVRAAVLALVAVGFSAASASTNNVNVASASKVAPVQGLPMCGPNSGQVCGLQ